MSKRVTQRDIARLAQVSQATVSLVLNATDAAAGRIPAETRERVNKVIRETGYVADPVARRMVKGLNRILGVFTYEPAFPSAQADFFTPLLLGIESAAQELGYDLLLLTGAGESRKIFGDNVRLRLADGCLILGRRFDPDELARLVRSDFPFVAVGRRDDAGGPVPYVGVDYVPATAELVRRARQFGHQRIAYVGPDSGAESIADRWLGFQQAMVGADLVATLPGVGRPAEEVLDTVRRAGASCVFFSEYADAIGVERLARARGLSVPGDLSIIVLGHHLRAEQSATAFTSLFIPREAMARAATHMLVRRVESNAPVEQQLLPCEPVEGETLGPISSVNHQAK
ncbi:MAG: LacI family transcriptional regulator [Pelagibacterium sp. SCN 64-44]|nr:MAG: LacI family transcriptional regulator [Pelagibacterium sp. SCN 64-44]